MKEWGNSSFLPAFSPRWKHNNHSCFPILVVFSNTCCVLHTWLFQVHLLLPFFFIQIQSTFQSSSHPSLGPCLSHLLISGHFTEKEKMKMLCLF